MWIVHATPPKSGDKWDFPENYFPRTVIYKKDALARAEEARRKGGTDVKIVKKK